MRLIDKDYAVDTAWSIEVYHGSAREVCEMLEDAPIVDAVKHGHWIEVNDPIISCKCSVCDAEYYLYEDDIYGYPYCAKCGAKMDAERKEE